MHKEPTKYIHNKIRERLQDSKAYMMLIPRNHRSMRGLCFILRCITDLGGSSSSKLISYKMKTVIYKIITLAFCLFAFSFATLGVEKTEETIAQDTKLTARVYCFYVPKAKAKASPDEQIRSATYEKLLVQGSKDSVKVPAIYKNNDFVVAEKEYYNLFELCQGQVHPKGNMLDLKGTDAGYFETFTRFYRIAIGSFKEGDPDNEILTMSQALTAAKVSDDEIKAIYEVLDNNKELVNKISQELAKTSLSNQIINGLKDIADSDHVSSALSVAAFLAAVWFAPALVASGAEILYPIIYQALWGIPSKWGLSYWLIYYPGKMKAMSWAYGNSAAIIKAAGIALGVGTKAYKAISAKLSKPEIKEELNDLSQSIIAK